MLKKNNYKLDSLILVVIIFISYILGRYNDQILNYFNLSNINDDSFAMGVWQVQITISLISISLVSITVANINNLILGQRLSEALMLRKKNSLTYWDKIFIAFALGIVNFIYVANGYIISEIFIFILNVFIIIITVKDTFEIISEDEDFINVVKEYFKYENNNKKIKLKKHKGKKDKDVYTKLSLSLKNKIINNEIWEYEKEFIIELIEDINNYNDKMLCLIIKQLVNNLVNYYNFEELNIFLDDMIKINSADEETKMNEETENKYLDYRIAHSIISGIDETRTIFLNTDNQFITEKIDILVKLYKISDTKTIGDKDEIRRIINSIEKLFIQICTNIISLKEVVYTEKLFKGVLEAVYLNENKYKNTKDEDANTKEQGLKIPPFLNIIMNEISDTYLSINNFNDNCIKEYINDYTACNVISMPKYLIDSLSKDIEEDKYYSNPSLIKVLSNFLIKCISNIYRNTNFDDFSRRHSIQVVINGNTCYKIDESDLNNEGGSFFDTIKIASLGRMTEVLYNQNKDIYYLNKLLEDKANFNDKSNNKEYFYNNIIFLNILICRMHNDNRLDEIFLKNIIDTNKDIFFNTDFKEYLIKYIFNSSKFTFTNKDNNNQIALYYLASGMNFDKDLEFKDNLFLKNMIKINENYILEIANLLNIKVDFNYELIHSKFIENLNKNIKKELSDKIENKTYQSLVDEAIVIYPNEIKKHLEKFKFNIDLIKDHRYLVNIPMQIHWEKIATIDDLRLMPADVFGEYAHLRINNNMVIIIRNIILHIYNELSHNLQHINSCEAEKIEDIINSNEDVEIFNNKKIINVIQANLTNKKFEEVESFMDYYNYLNDNALNDLGALILINPQESIQICYSDIEINNYSDAEVEGIVDKNFAYNKSTASFKINDLLIDFNREEFGDFIKNVLLKLTLNLYVKIDYSLVKGYYIK